MNPVLRVARVALAMVLLLAGFVRPAPADAYVELRLVNADPAAGWLRIESFPFEFELGTVEVRVDDIREARLSEGEDQLVTAAGSLRGRILLAEYPFEDASGRRRIPRSQVQAWRRVPPPVADPAARETPAEPGPNEAVLRSLVALPAPVTRVRLAGNGRWVFLLLADRKRLVRIDARSGALDPTTAASWSRARDVRPSADGLALHLFGPTDTDWQRGQIRTLDAETLQLRTALDVDIGVLTLDVDAQGRFFAAGRRAGRLEIARIGTDGKFLDCWPSGAGETLLAVHPAGGRLYLAGPGPVGAWILPRKAGERPVEYRGESPNRARECVFSAAGDWMVTDAGDLLRLAAGEGNDLVRAASVEPHVSAALHAGARILLIVTRDGRLIRYGGADWQRLGVCSLGLDVEAAAIDPARGRLYAAGHSQAHGWHLRTYSIRPPGQPESLAAAGATEPTTTVFADGAPRGRAPAWTPERIPDRPCPTCHGSKQWTFEVKREPSGVRIRYDLSCPICSGRGKVDLLTCEACRGLGDRIVHARLWIDGVPISTHGYVPCRRCDATGQVVDQAWLRKARGADPIACPACRGRGTVSALRLEGAAPKKETRPCPYCDGTGRIRPVDCTTCAGKGSRSEWHTVLLASESVTVDLIVPCADCEGAGIRRK